MRISDWRSDVCSSELETMLAAADAGGDAVVIGGGLLGLEAAHGLSLRGMKVTVIHLMPTLMERQLDEAAGWLLKQALEARGQTILTGADTAEIIGDGKVEGVKLKDGTLRSEEHTSELQSLMRISYAVFCL